MHLSVSQFIYPNLWKTGLSFNHQAGGAGGAQAALTALASTGLEVAITELDIAGGAANDYVTVLRACLNTAACEAITSWGVRDTVSDTLLSAYILILITILFQLGLVARKHQSSSL